MNWNFKTNARLNPRANIRIKKQLGLGKRPKFICIYCEMKKSAKKGTLEHIVPLSLGGGNNKWNLALACAECNYWRNVLITKLTQGKVPNAVGGIWKWIEFVDECYFLVCPGTGRRIQLWPSVRKTP